MPLLTRELSLKTELQVSLERVLFNCVDIYVGEGCMHERFGFDSLDVFFLCAGTPSIQGGKVYVKNKRLYTR